MGCYQSVAKVHQSAKQCASVWKSMKSAKDHRQWLLIGNNYQILLYKYGFLYLIGF